MAEKEGIIQGLKKQKLTAKQWGILITVCVMFFFSPTFMAIAPTFMLMPDVFGVTPAQAAWLNSISAPLCMVSGLFVGIFVGSKISYRATAIFATVMFTVFGGLPFIWQSIPWNMLLLCRFIFGLGMGCFNPLLNSILVHMFTSETARATWIGVTSAVMSLSGIVAMPIVGALSNGGHWQNAYAFYLFCAIAVILAIIFIRDKDILTDVSKEDLEKEAQAKGEGYTAAAWKAIPGIAIAFILVFTLCTIITGGFRDYMSQAMGKVGYTPLDVGALMSFYSIVGTVISVFNVVLWKWFRQWGFPVAFACLGIGFLLVLIGYNNGTLAIFYLAAIFMGVGRSLTGMCLPMIISTTVPPVAMTACMGLMSVTQNLGMFLGAPWMRTVEKLFGENPQVQMIAFIGLAAVACILACICAAAARKKLAAAEAAKAEAAA